MAMNGLRNLAQVLETGGNEIVIDEAVRERAALPIRRLLEFAKQRKRVVLGDNDA
jgi:quinolinate synthase